MANRNYIGKNMYSMHAMPVEIDGRVDIGASGAASNQIGPCISSITRVAAGLYKIVLSDNYNKVYNVSAMIQSPVTGSALRIDGSSTLTIGQVYQITALGTSTQADWEAAGLSPGIPAAVGVSFVSLITGGGTGTGAVKAIAASGINQFEVVGDPNLMCNPSAPNQGAVIMLQCYGPTDADTTTQIAKDPASGSKLQIMMLVSNSSVIVSGE